MFAKLGGDGYLAHFGLSGIIRGAAPWGNADILPGRRFGHACRMLGRLDFRRLRVQRKRGNRKYCV